jgi:hypothetical protein
MEIPEPPKCPRKLRAYLELLRQAAMTARPIAGRNTSVSEQPGQGTTVNADDCAACPE